MVLPIPILLMYSIQPTLSIQTYNCCSGPPIWALGPPPKPPWLKYKLECNSKGAKIENSSVGLHESTAAFQDAVLGGLTVVQLVILIICVLLLIAVFVILIIYAKRKYKATVKPDIVKEEETNYLYNYRILGRAWRGRQRQTSWRPKRTIGPEDRKYLVNGTPSSQLSLASNDTEPSPNGDDEKEIPGTRRSSTSSGIGTSQGESGPEVGSLSGRKAEFSALPILSPIKSSAGPDTSQTSRIDSERYVDPQALSGRSTGVVSVTNSSQNAVVSLPNPRNWNIDDDRISGEHKHGKLAPISPTTEALIPDGNDHPKKRRKKKRSTSSQETNQSPQSVPLKTISNGKINSKLKLSPIPDVSGESQA